MTALCEQMSSLSISKEESVFELLSACYKKLAKIRQNRLQRFCDIYLTGHVLRPVWIRKRLSYYGKAKVTTA